MELEDKATSSEPIDYEAPAVLERVDVDAQLQVVSG
jgi:hypothetical protein